MPSANYTAEDVRLVHSKQQDRAIKRVAKAYSGLD